jgi:hypothetical protein
MPTHETTRVRRDAMPVNHVIAASIATNGHGDSEPDDERDYVFRETLHEPAEIRAALRSLVERKATATVDDGPRVVRLQVDGYDDGAAELTFRMLGAAPRPPFVIVASGYYARYRMLVRRMRAEPGLLHIGLPEAIERVRSRRSHRVSIAEDLRVSFDHPLFPERRVVRPVLDLTHDGLSFAADSSCGALEAGIDIPFMLVERANGDVIGLRASIKNRRATGGRDALAFGCTIEAQGTRDAVRWRATCDELLFPNTRRGAAEVWSVYRESGYFGLSDTLDGFDHLRAQYVDASRALSSAPELGCQSSWPARGPAVATVTNLRLYPSCWFSYHLAVRPERAVATRVSEVLRELYRQYIEHSQTLPGARWQMAYVQHSAHWSMRVHVDVPRRYHARGDSLVHEFRALQVRTVGARGGQRPALLSATLASDLEVEQAMRAVRVRRPDSYCDALEYNPDPDRFRLITLKRAWAHSGMERERDLLVARNDGAIVAVGVVEAAQPGLHLFGLLDTLRMYAVTPDGVHAFETLLDGARAWFRQHNRRSFCYLEEEGELVADGVDIKLMSRAMMTLLSTERLPEMLEQLHSETAMTPDPDSSTRPQQSAA